MCFTADGKNGKIDFAMLQFGMDSTLVVERTQSKKSPFLMRAMLTGPGGHIFHVYDFNCDGEWD